MTVRELLVGLQYLPRDLEVLAFEAGCDDYCEREVDELDLQAAASTCTWGPDATCARPENVTSRVTIPRRRRQVGE